MASKESKSSKPKPTSKPTEGRSVTNAKGKPKPTSKPSGGKPVTKRKVSKLR